MHKFSVGHVFLFVSLVLSASAGLRGSSRSLALMFSFMGLSISAPSWYSGRLWLLRIGYYKLTRPKEQADDWIWIIDHTIQCGQEKCLLIVGIRLSALPAAETILNHDDLEPLELYPVTKSNGEIVYQQLEETVKKTGVPREIISDCGSDIKAGIDLFCRKHSETCFIYDIKHKAAAILKRELAGDKVWQEFIKLTTETRKALHQTKIADLAPPNQRSKSRYMNIDRLIVWGSETLIWMDQKEHGPDSGYDFEYLNGKLGWLRRYRTKLKEWKELMGIVDTVVDFVRYNGIYRGSHIDLKRIPEMDVRMESAERIRDELIGFIRQESLKARKDERLLGSSEVIESVFGKLKYLERDQSRDGFTVFLLSLAAIVSKTTKEVVQKALETVPTKQVFEWFQRNIGRSVQSKRIEVKRTVKNMEQKWDQIEEGCFM
jgi:hypothetical protein